MTQNKYQFLILSSCIVLVVVIGLSWDNSEVVEVFDIGAVDLGNAGHVVVLLDVELANGA